MTFYIELGTRASSEAPSYQHPLDTSEMYSDWKSLAGHAASLCRSSSQHYRKLLKVLELSVGIEHVFCVWGVLTWDTGIGGSICS